MSRFAKVKQENTQDLGELDAGYRLGQADEVEYEIKSKKGLTERLVRQISKRKSEPKWMLEMRLSALKRFEEMPIPKWGGDIGAVKFDEIHYYLRPKMKEVKSWDEVPKEVKATFEKIGVPQAEREYLAGVKSQWDSEVIYGSLKKVLAKKGVVFLSMDEGLKQYPDIVKKYFGTVVPLGDNKLAALNTAVWSGGSFVYVPKGVEVDLPLQAYFRINSENAGQFERTLIVVEEGAKVHYVEGCSAPAYTSGSLHAAVVEIVVKTGARCQYTTVQNWYKNVFNLVTKRAWVGEGGEMRWIDGNLGCIAENQKLITPDGVVKIEQVKVGQKVLSYDERKERLVFRRVLAKRNSGRQRVYDVSIGARKIRVTRNHPFYSYRYDSTRPKKLGRYELGFVRADELSKAIVPRTSLDYGKEYGLKKPKLRTEFWSGNQHKNGLRVVREQKSRLKIGDRTTGKLMWLFGYWLGDGDMSIKYGVNEKVVRWAKLGFSCPKDNRARERLMGIMSEVVGASPTERKDGVHVSWSSKELVELFVTNGFVGKAIDKRVPGWVWSLPEEQRVAFVSGYIDADGTVKEGRIDIKSVNKALLEDVASLLVTLGITSRLFTEFSESREVTIQGCKTVAHGSYRLSFEIDGRFERYIAGVLVDKIKQVSPKVKEQKRLVGRSGIKLGGDVEIARVKFEDVGKELPTWDIEVEGTGNFICEGFIVHNSRLTMKYPACILAGKGAKGETLSIAWAGEGQHQDAGAKMIHLAPKTSSRIISKSISKDGGRASYRGMVQMSKGARGAKSKVVCDALILDDKSRSDTYPVNRIWENEVSLEHEATVSKVGEEQLFYLMSRGISEHEAEAMIVNGFLEPVMKEIPFEYAIEMNRLVNLEMEGSVG